ncbi:MAG: hypothetical protein ABIG28_01040 [archaeon]
MTKKKPKKNSEAAKRVEELKEKISQKRKYLDGLEEPKQVYCIGMGDVWVSDGSTVGAEDYFRVQREIRNLSEGLDEIYKTHVPFKRGTKEYTEWMSDLITKKRDKFEDQDLSATRNSPNYEYWSDDLIVVKLNDYQAGVIADLRELLNKKQYG